MNSKKFIRHHCIVTCDTDMLLLDADILLLQKNCFPNMTIDAAYVGRVSEETWHDHSINRERPARSGPRAILQDSGSCPGVRVRLRRYSCQIRLCRARLAAPAS
jgi:hypothetical protein